MFWQMWALSPSIFDLLSERLDPTDPWMAECHPCVQYAILHTLYGHCCRHGNFVSSSNLLATDTVSLATMSQATREYLTRILRLLVALLEGPRTSFDVRCLVLKWVQELVNGLQSTSHVFVMPPCLSVVRAVIAQGGCGLGGETAPVYVTYPYYTSLLFCCQVCHCSRWVWVFGVQNV